MSLNELVVPHGTFQLSDSEKDFLARESQCKFQKHPIIDGVQVRQLNPKLSPRGIQRVLSDVGGVPRQFFIVKAVRGIPFHPHTEEAELCFGGSGGVAVFVNDQKEEIGRFELQPDFYSIVKSGNWHGTAASQEVVFCGIKFIENLWCICQIERAPAFFGKIEEFVGPLVRIRVGSKKNDLALCSWSQVRRFVTAEDMLEKFSRLPGNNFRQTEKYFLERFPLENESLSK
ncbi:MAG: hypothetical protein Q7T51_03305 [Candidatus Moranbacteria bacterium]|nr:hypothetical protein [Candidatus Moranbacteria bacterium]